MSVRLDVTLLELEKNVQEATVSTAEFVDGAACPASRTAHDHLDVAPPRAVRRAG